MNDCTEEKLLLYAEKIAFLSEGLKILQYFSSNVWSFWFINKSRSSPAARSYLVEPVTRRGKYCLSENILA